MTVLEELMEMGRRMEEKLDSLNKRLDSHLGIEAPGTMNYRDELRITTSDDILGAIDQWNAKHKRPRRKGVRA